MTTSLVDINDLFLTMVTDYRLTALYNSNLGNFNTYLEGFLIQAIDDFTDLCNQDLTYDLGTQEFSVTLTLRNKMILAKMMKRNWLSKEVHNILQMNNFITDHDFKMHSAAQNLREKKDLLILANEEIDQALLDYGYAATDWDNWKLQVFDE